MLQAVSIAGIVLMLIGMVDPRARALVALIALVWLETAISSSLLTGDHLWAARWGMRVPIDIVAGFMALTMTLKCEMKNEGPPLWMLAVPACFILMLMAHAAFWMARFNGIDLWGIYPHALNVLFLLQLACLAWPGGGQLIGRLRDWSSRLVDGWRDRISPALERIFDTQADRHPDQAACPASHPARREPSNRQADFVGVSSPAPVAR